MALELSLKLILRLLRSEHTRRQVATYVLFPEQVATKRLFGAHAMISDEVEWEVT